MSDIVAIVVWFGGIVAISDTQDFGHAMFWPFFLGKKLAAWCFS